MRRPGPFAIACALGLTACARPSGGPRGVAEAFLDAHYVRIDLQASRAFCSGLALSKIEHELELTRGVSVGEDTLKPHVHYRLEREREEPAHALYAYELTVRPPGSESFRRVVMLTVRDREGAWTVTNYDDGELGGR